MPVSSLYAYFNWCRDQDATTVAVVVTRNALIATIGGSRAVGGGRGVVRRHRLHDDASFSYPTHRRQALLLQTVHQLIFF